MASDAKSQKEAVVALITRMDEDKKSLFKIYEADHTKDCTVKPTHRCTCGKWEAQEVLRKIAGF